MKLLFHRHDASLPQQEPLILPLLLPVGQTPASSLQCQWIQICKGTSKSLADWRLVVHITTVLTVLFYETVNVDVFWLLLYIFNRFLTVLLYAYYYSVNNSVLRNVFWLLLLLYMYVVSCTLMSQIIRAVCTHTYMYDPCKHYCYYDVYCTYDIKSTVQHSHTVCSHATAHVHTYRYMIYYYYVHTYYTYMYMYASCSCTKTHIHCTFVLISIQCTYALS